MSIIYVLLPVAVLLAIAAVIAFVLAVRSGQFDDLDTPAVRMLYEDEDEDGDDDDDDDEATACHHNGPAPPTAAD